MTAQHVRKPDTSPPPPPGQTSAPKAGFLSLPAELRNDIYALAVQRIDGRKRNFANFKPPAITRVSRQLRAESMPIFFSECQWFAVTDGSLNGLVPNANIRQLLCRMDSNAVRFHDIEIQVSQCRPSSAFPTENGELPKLSLAGVLKLKVTPLFQVESQLLQGHMRHAHALFYRFDLRYLERLAKRIGSRADFDGFTPADIFHLAEWLWC